MKENSVGRERLSGVTSRSYYARGTAPWGGGGGGEIKVDPCLTLGKVDRKGGLSAEEPALSIKERGGKG